MQFFDQTGVI